MALKDHVSRVEATIEQGVYAMLVCITISMFVTDLEEADKEIVKANEQDIVSTYQVCIY